MSGRGHDDPLEPREAEAKPPADVELAAVQRLIEAGGLDEALLRLDALLDGGHDSWQLWHLRCTAFHRKNDRRAAASAGEEGARRFGMNAALFDGLLPAWLRLPGGASTALEAWADVQAKLDLTTGAAANIVAHVVVAFCAAGRADEGRALLGLADGARGTQESKRGLMDFNLSCLCALTDDVDGAVAHAAHAIAAGYGPDNFLDHDFDAVRRKPLFADLDILLRAGGRSFVALARSDAERIEVWTEAGRVRLIEPRADIDGVRQPWRVVDEPRPPHQLLHRRREHLDALAARGYVVVDDPCASFPDWQAPLSRALRALRAADDPSAPVEVEWTSRNSEPLPTHARYQLRVGRRPLDEVTLRRLPSADVLAALWRACGGDDATPLHHIAPSGE